MLVCEIRTGFELFSLDGALFVAGKLVNETASEIRTVRPLRRRHAKHFSQAVGRQV
jgi:hypothetical protein